MYKVHHDATLLPVELECGDYQFGDEKIPTLNVSASQDKTGKIHISLCNLDPKNSAELVCRMHGVKSQNASGRVLTADAMTAHNTFENPKTISIKAFRNFKLRGGTVKLTLPSKSVVVLGIK
jgi:alpha-N-arabinofuranosidase